jgi:hypothetical protein
VDLIYALRTLRRRWVWALIGLIPAAYLALSSAYHVGTSGLTKKSLEFGAAQTQVLIDSKKSSLAYAGSDIGAFSSRAQIFSQFLQINPVKQEIAQKLGVQPNQIAVTIPSGTPGVPSVQNQAQQRSNGLLQESNALQLLVVSQQGLPLISLYAQGPTGEAAAALANVSADALKHYVQGLQHGQAPQANTPVAINGFQLTQVRVRQLGTATGSMVDTGTSKKVVVMTFIGLLVLDFILVILLSGFLDKWRLREEVEAAVAEAPRHDSSRHEEAQRLAHSR